MTESSCNMLLPSSLSNITSRESYSHHSTQKHIEGTQTTGGSDAWGFHLKNFVVVVAPAKVTMTSVALK